MSELFLLTGATGFVGSQILNILLDQGKKVRVTVRNSNQASKLELKKLENIIISPDIFLENEEWWANTCKGVHTIIHAAWYTKPGMYLESVENLACLCGTLELAKGASKANIKKFVGIGTCFEYEFSNSNLSVNTPLKPMTLYAATKAAAYMTLTQWFLMRKIQFIWCRLFYLYGEGEDQQRFVPYLRSKLKAGKIAELTTGNQIRDFLNVSDAGRLIIESALGDDEGPVNICSGIGVSVRDFAESIANEYGRVDLLKFGARQENLVDPPYIVGIRRSIL